MIREPYNITPYNSTIDTSRINEFGFNFSGDELGSWQAEVAKNNSSPEVLFTSKQYYPVDAGYDRIFDGDRVEGTLVPSWIKATNSGEYDGEIKRLYSISDENVPTQGSNAKVFIQKKIGTIEAGDIYETIAVGERRIVNNSDSNIIYFAFNTEYIFEESSNEYYISYKVDNVEETEPVIKSFSFVGYLLIADNKNNRINFSSDDAVQIENIVFVPSINTINLGDYLEIYLLNQEGSASPDYLPIDKYVTYYIFTYNGTENDTYSGENIIISDVLSADIQKVEVKIPPYQSDIPWAGGKGENKFNRSNFTSFSIESKYHSIWGATTVSGRVVIAPVEDGFSFKVSILSLNYNFSGSIDPYTFFFGDNIASIYPNFQMGKTYYFNFFDSAIPTPLTNFLFILSDGNNYLDLPIGSQGVKIPGENYKIVGFKVSANNITQDEGVSFNIKPVISETSSITEWTPYEKEVDFYNYSYLYLINNLSEGNPQSSRFDISEEMPHGGLFVINSIEDTEQGGKNCFPQKNPYKEILSYNHSRDKELVTNKRWWSTLDVYQPGTYPSENAMVIYEEIIEDTEYYAEEFGIIIDPSKTNSLTVNVDHLSNLSFEKVVIKQSPNKDTIALRQAVGEDLIWRLKMWEPDREYIIPHEEPEENETRVNPNTTNFIKRGKFLQNASQRINNNTYEGEVSLLITENIESKEDGFNYVQIGDDLFIENNTDGIIATIMPSIIYTDLATDMNTFTTALTPNNCLLEIDNYRFRISSAILSNDQSYITLTLTSTDDLVNNLIPKNYYDYTIEFLSDPGEAASLINGYVKKYKYVIIPEDLSGIESPYPEFTIQVNNAAPNKITTMHYWIYSDGTPRAFYTLENPIKGQIRGRDYRLYSNFYNSNWYFFQSRSTPEIEINYYIESSYSGSFPVIGYSHRSIRLNATYSQAENVGIKYHTWQIDKIDGDEVITVFQSNEIYNSNFKCTFDSLEEKASYIITFTAVNYDGVVTSISGNLTTDFEIDEVDQAECVATVNNNAHIAEVTWMNGLASEPEEGKGDSEDFGNHIGVGPEEQDVTIGDGEQLTYSTIAGAPINIDSENLSFQTGFVINDDAKVDGKNEEFYDSTFLKIIGKDASSSSLVFDKLGLDVDIKEDNPAIEWKLLNDISGQVDSDTHSNANFFLGKNYIWNEVEGTEIVEEEEVEIKENWDDELIWTETESDTNCYYYQIVGGYYTSETPGTSEAFELKVQRTPFSYHNKNFTYEVNTEEVENEEPIVYHTLTIPYNPLLDVAEVSSSYPLWVKLYDGINGTEKSVHQVSNIDFDSENSPKTKMILTLEPTNSNNQWPASTVTEVVVYGLSEQVGSPVRVSLPEKITSFILGPRTSFFYFTVYDGSKGTLPTNITPSAFGEKPDWNDSETIVLNAKFNGTNISSKQAEITSSVDTYKIYRIKYRRVSNIEAEDEIIYRRLIGEFSLTQEELTSVPKFRFIDWAIENKGIFGYEIVPSSSENGITEATIKCNNKIITDWYGWSFTEIAKFHDTWHYEPIERWLFKLNVETNGYSHQTNKVFHQGFNRYPKASIGMTNYITTNVSCLIGDIRKELQKITYYAKQQGYTRDTIESIQAWEDFSNTSNMILVKDYKGRAFIGVIDGNAMSFQDVVVDILTNLSFNITQIDDAANYQIFSIEEG